MKHSWWKHRKHVNRNLFAREKSASFVCQVLYGLILAKRGVALPISMPLAPMDFMRLSSSTALEATEVTLTFLSRSKSLTWVLPSVADRHMHYSSVECDQHWSTHTEQGNCIVECRLVCYLASRWIGAVGSQQHSGSAGQESLPAALLGLPTDHLLRGDGIAGIAYPGCQGRLKAVQGGPAKIM